MSKIPVTIITGFLGAGKTTFLQYALTANHGLRIAVVQNELGDEIGGIEQAVVMSAANEAGTTTQWLQLPNGCICCSAKDDLLLSLETILHAPDGSTRFDYVLVELSGLADPGPVAGVFWVDDALESRLALDAVVTFVDARNIGQQLRQLPATNGSINEAQRQVAIADRIVVNKRDLVSDQQLNDVKDELRAINAAAPILVTERSRVPLEEVMNIGAFDVARELSLPSAAAAADVDACDCSDDGHDDHDHHRHHQKHRHVTPSSHEHAADVVTCLLAHAGDVELAAVTDWLGELLWRDDGLLTVFRCKGLLAVRGESCKYMLQGVCALFDIQPSPLPWADGETRECKLMFIGKGISAESLRDSFQKRVLAVT